MRTMLSVRTGGPETLQLTEVEDPVPGPGQVLVRVAACGLNYPDVLIIQDLYQKKPARPFAPGIEVSGVVEALGAGVEVLRIGQRVAAQVDQGGLAEKVVADADKCFVVPDEIPLTEAAGFLVVYGTSHFALKTCAGLRSGETVLVLGAAGGVGLAAVELGHAMGARVIAAASTQAKVDLAMTKGADAGLVYPSENFDRAASKDFTARLLELTDGAGVDVVYDPVGGAYSEAALRGIAWAGRYLVVGFTAGIQTLPMNLPLLKGCSIIGVLWGLFLRRHGREGEAILAEVLELYRQGIIQPQVTMRFPLEQAREALRVLASRQATGKVVVTMSGDV